MSAIGAIAGGVAQFIQSLNPSNAASATSNASNGTLTGHHHHHGGGQLNKLVDAITNALKGAANGSGGSITNDPNQTITQALTKIFQNGSLSSTSTTDTDGDTSQTAADTNNPTSALPDDFVQTLKSFGVTAQQFQTDLKSALQSAQQSGNFDPSTILKNFPAGSILDALG